MPTLRAKGMTIVELLIVCAVAGGMSLVFMAALRMGQRSWQIGSAQMSVSSELRRGVVQMRRELAESRMDLLSIPADGLWYPALSFQVPTDLNGDGTVLDANGVLEWSNPVSYSLGGSDGDQALRVQGAQSRVLANGVTLLQFRRQAATPMVVEMNLTVRRGATTGFVNQDSLTERVRLRN
ncbi:MAG: hypothetical protein HYZ93_05370 [Candidatus Omnitrophica bacterium]|nr:hypothetical protein [Candidatus Omnitrophota bacterium]